MGVFLLYANYTSVRLVLLENICQIVQMTFKKKNHSLVYNTFPGWQVPWASGQGPPCSVYPVTRKASWHPRKDHLSINPQIFLTTKIFQWGNECCNWIPNIWYSFFWGGRGEKTISANILFLSICNGLESFSLSLPLASEHCVKLPIKHVKTSFTTSVIQTTLYRSDNVQTVLLWDGTSSLWGDYSEEGVVKHDPLTALVNKVLLERSQSQSLTHHPHGCLPSSYKSAFQLSSASRGVGAARDSSAWRLETLWTLIHVFLASKSATNHAGRRGKLSRKANACTC